MGFPRYFCKYVKKSDHFKKSHYDPRKSNDETYKKLGVYKINVAKTIGMTRQKLVKICIYLNYSVI